mgnify:CR=1 FL=1
MQTGAFQQRGDFQIFGAIQNVIQRRAQPADGYPHCNFDCAIMAQSAHWGPSPGLEEPLQWSAARQESCRFECAIMAQSGHIEPFSGSHDAWGWLATTSKHLPEP